MFYNELFFIQLKPILHFFLFFRSSCRLASELVQLAGSLLSEGETADRVERAVHEEAVRRGAYPSTLHFKGQEEG